VDGFVIRLGALFPAKRLSVLLTIIALALWSYSLTQAKLNLDGYGLIHSLPISFFVAVGALILANSLLWKNAEGNGPLLWMQLFLLVIMLWLTPVIISGIHYNLYPYNYESYDSWRYVDYINANGHFQSSSSLWYFDWPGASIEVTAVSNICNIGRDVFVLATPVLIQLFQLLFMYVFLKNMFSEKKQYIWAGLILFNFINYKLTRPNPAEFGVLLLLVLLCLLTAPKFRERINENIGYTISIIIVFFGLTTSHLLTSIAGLFLIVSFFIASRRKDITLIILAAAFIGAWIMYGATATFERTLPRLLVELFRVDILTNAVTSRLIGGDPAHQIAVYLKIFEMAFVACLAALGCILDWKNHRYSWANKFALSGSIGTIFTGLAAVGYGAMVLLERIFMYCSSMIAYFAVKVLDIKRGHILLTLVALLLVPLFFISAYETVAGEFVTPSFLAADHFLKENTRGSVIDPLDRRRLGYEPEGSDKQLTSLTASYIALSPLYKGYYSTFYDDPAFVDRVQSALDYEKYGIIYTNPDVSIYINDDKVH
jgi:hypothetical protein